ncbi:site-specific integrase [Saccharopolyspora shandongensis]|uniref:tyrosine-type recombinase/integrase n=1 Tax=Saccharopolyspora shandongensis TaxID=418495 RepID=UPI0034002E4F
MDPKKLDGSTRDGRLEIDAVHILLEKLGMHPADLLDHDATRISSPIFAEYVPKVAESATPGARRVYTPYWTRIIDRWGARRLDEPSPSEIRQFAGQIRAQAVTRRNSRGGRSAEEHFIGAMRCIYAHAVADRLITKDADPARLVPKPRRLPSTRRAVPDSRLAEISHVVATTGNDPILDSLLLRLHVESACRRGGALALRPRDLDREQCLIFLREKGGTVRWQPVSPTLMAHLVAHADQRGPQDPDAPLLRYASGRPITARRYDYLWNRVGRHLPWSATQQISIHWIRHTTLKWVERNFGYAVARAYAGHTDRGHEPSATTTYIRADLDEVATALSALTGEPHPLTEQADAEGW